MSKEDSKLKSKNASTMPFCSPNNPEKSPETSVAPTSSDVGVMWRCGVCTLSNQSLALICEACGNPKHDSRATKKQNVWSCKFCTLNNSTEVEKCLACGEWRYSYGAPAFSRGPYVGT